MLYKLNKIEELQEYHRYLSKLEIMQRWMIGDLKRSSIDANANLLVAMGIFNYMEILGSFFKPQALSEAGLVSGKSRFYFVINNLLPKEYKNVCRRIDRLTINGCYDTLRSGMTHEYLVKTNTMKNKDIELRFTIVGCSTAEEYDKAIASELCGIKLVKIHPKFYKLLIYNPRFIHDLDFAFNKYKLKLKNGIKDYRKAFILRVWETNIHLLN